MKSVKETGHQEDLGHMMLTVPFAMLMVLAAILFVGYFFL